MTLWQQLQHTFEQAQAEGAFTKVIGSDLLQTVEALSTAAGQPPERMILLLLDQAISDRRCWDRAYSSWDALSERERQVAALVCAGLTGKEVAVQLVLSPETVKTHVRHILRKFNLSSRRELRRLLADWDLSPWLADYGT